MRGFNRVILAGNLTRDPELRYTPKGTAVAQIGLAINRAWRDQETNELREEVTFVDAEAWGRTAETIGQYMKKGSAILIEGRLKLDTWDDKQTQQKRSKLKVVIETSQFLGSPGGGDGPRGDSPRSSEAPVRRPSAAPAAPPPPSEPEGMPPEEDDVPF